MKVDNKEVFGALRTGLFYYFFSAPVRFCKRFNIKTSKLQWHQYFLVI